MPDLTSASRSQLLAYLIHDRFLVERKRDHGVSNIVCHGTSATIRGDSCRAALRAHHDFQAYRTVRMVSARCRQGSDAFFRRNVAAEVLWRPVI